jgi:hypothetical protein
MKCSPSICMGKQMNIAIFLMTFFDSFMFQAIYAVCFMISLELGYRSIQVLCNT